MRQFHFIFFRLSFYLTVGILTAYLLPINSRLLFAISAIATILFLFSFFRSRFQIFSDSLFGISSFLMMFSIGLLAGFFSIAENQPRHFVNLDFNASNPIAEVLITEELKHTSHSRRYLAKVEKVYSENLVLYTKGKILLNLKVDRDEKSPIPGNRMIIPWKPQQIDSPLNPFQFDYKRYMRNIGVERQVVVFSSEIKFIDNKTFGIARVANISREKLIQKLKAHSFDQSELGVLQALLLGQRREIDDQLYKNYASAGAIHILAISGLHIGILLLILNFLLQPIERLKNGKLIKMIVLLGILWSFAVFVGLSPSVVRAVTMFSFIGVGMQLKRKNSTLNALCLSWFFLLIINPKLLFQVGFQLSFLAVLGIIIIQPILYAILKTENKVVNYFWKMTTVSVAAQIAILPLSIYYFHQFPGLFLVSNLVILPFLGFILVLGIVTFLLAGLNLLPKILTSLLEIIIWSLNQFIQKIASIELMIFDNIDFSLLQAFSAYFLLFIALTFVLHRSVKNVMLLLVAVIVFQLTFIENKYSIPKNEFMVFHKPGHRIITVKKGNTLSIISDDSIQVPKDYIRERQISNLNYLAQTNILKFSNKTILVVDSAQAYKFPEFKPDIIILENSAKINLERIIKNFHPQLVIADGSNYQLIVRRWQQTLIKQKIPFHYTGEKGAYMLKEL